MSFVRRVGEAANILFKSILVFPAVFRNRDSRADFMVQLHRTGIGTLPVVTIVSLFVGMILALQVGLELQRFNQEIYLGAAVMVAMIREMGPFACGMCLASCIGSTIAAELGSMKINEELDALECMSISPIRFLAAPRILALVIMAPLLSFFCCILGTIGGGMVGATQLGVEFRQYCASAMSMADTKDLVCGLTKALIFGLLIGTVSVAEGFNAERGATGVGRATQRSVIIGFLMILLFGYVVTRVCYQ